MGSDSNLIEITLKFKEVENMNENLSKKSLGAVIAVCLIVPVIVAVTYNQVLGIVLFLIGLYISLQAYRAYNRSKTADFLSGDSPKQHGLDRGRTIRVSIVDEQGRELPAQVVEQRLAEARAQAGPKDTIVPVRFVISPEDD
jgi:hypothetical protein